MEVVAQLRRGISRQFSTGSMRKSGRFSFKRQSSMDPHRNAMRFSFGRQSSLDPIRRSVAKEEPLTVPDNLDATMQLLFMACTGDVNGIQDLLDAGSDVNSIDLDGRTALHIAACEGHVEVVNFLLSRKANINARDRWGSTAAADAKYYGNMEVYNILKAQGAKVPKTRKTPMVVANSKQVPEYELNPFELQVRRSDGIAKGVYQIAKWNGTKVTVKILDKESYSDPESINSFKNELTLMEKVRHPNIIQFVGAVTQNIPMMIVVEFHPKGDLGCYLQKKGRLSPSKSLKFALDIARGMNYLHECKPDPVVHCELMPKNILLDNGGHLKVAGFGLVRLSKISADKFNLADPAASTRNSSIYTAPELYKNEIFDKKVDVYSFAVIVYEIIVVSDGVKWLYVMVPSLNCSVVHQYMPEAVLERSGHEGTISPKIEYTLPVNAVVPRGSKEELGSNLVMIEGVHPFQPKSAEEAIQVMCLEGKRPAFKKLKNYPSELKELIELCWNEDPAVRPSFSEIILRLDTVVANGCKPERWKGAFKLSWL